MNKYKAILFIVLTVFSAMAGHALNNDGWSVWLDKQAEWENDVLHAPNEVTFSDLPVNQRSSGQNCI